MIDVLLVDDHPVMRALLRQLLEAYPDIDIVAEVENGEEAVIQARALQPTVAVIDCHLPRLSGIEVTRLIKVKSPSTTVIGLTAGEPTENEMEMLSAGASVVLNKADVLEQLCPLIVKSCAFANAQPATSLDPSFSVPIPNITR